MPAAAISALAMMMMLAPAHAQLTPVGQVPQGQNVRRFADTADRAEFMVKLYPEVIVNGKEERMTPAGRIFNEQNMIVMPASLTGKALVVNYTRDLMGQVKDVWILTEQERKLKSPRIMKAESDKALQQQMQNQGR